MANAKLICAAIVVVLTIVIGILAVSFKKVGNIEYGVQYDIHAKQLDDAAKSGGLYIGPPGYRFIKFPSTYISVDLNDRTCVSQDGLRVEFSVTFQYQIMELDVPEVIEKYRNFDKWATVVEAAGLSAIHHSCSEFVISDFQNKRAEIQASMQDNLKLKLEGDGVSKTGVYARAISVQLRNVELPSSYTNAVERKQEAEEDIALAKAQRTQETTKATTQLKTAEKEAQKILDTAENEATILVQEATLKAEETLYSFERETETIVALKEALALSTEGVLSYLTNMMLAEVDTLSVTSGEPARLSRKDLLQQN